MFKLYAETLAQTSCDDSSEIDFNIKERAHVFFRFDRRSFFETKKNLKIMDDSYQETAKALPNSMIMKDCVCKIIPAAGEGGKSVFIFVFYNIVDKRSYLKFYTYTKNKLG
jgi:hypothetical protein